MNMKKIRLLVLTKVLLLFSMASFAQEKKTISGVVKDEKGETLPGVTIYTPDSSAIVQTNMNGLFRVSVPVGQHELRFSFVGKQTREIHVDSINGEIAIVLSDLTKNSLEDVIVIGYGTAKKGNVTSSIASITEKDIKNLPVAGVDQMIQGKVSGVTVTSNTGQPGGGVAVRVRGLTSVSGDNQPLYVIDGVPVMTSTSSTSQDQLGGVAGQTNQSPMATLNPSDIESVQILKDASAQAIYGSMGAYGVILITTKKGKSGEGKLNYNGYYGVANRPKKLKLMDLSQYAQYYNSVVGEGTVDGLDSIPEFKNPSLLGHGTDWQDEIFQTGITQNHQLSFSGGQGKTTYYLSGNYFDQTGIVIGSNFRRYAVRANIDQQFRPWLKAGVSTNLSRTKQRVTLTDGQQSVIDLMMYNSPATPVRDATGAYLTSTNIAGVAFGNAVNPVALALLRKVIAQQSKAFGNVYLEAKLFPGLTFRNQLNYDFQLTENSAYQPLEFNSLNVQVIGPSRLRKDKSSSYFWGLQDYLTYDKTFGKHYVNLVAGHEADQSHYENDYISAYNLQNNMEAISAGTLDAGQTGSYTSSWGMESYFVRGSYAFANKYFFSGSLRRDGSSNFGPNKKWGTFPALSAGWNISNEKFASNWKNVLDNLKLRVGYGEIGGQNVSGTTAYSTNIRLIPSINGLFGQSSVAGVPANVGNPNLSWEAVKTYNIGIDAGFLNHRIDFTVDLYKKVTTNMILSTTLPSFAGLDPNPPSNSYKEIEPPVTNAGKMTNTGIDISINTVNIDNANFTWKTNVIFSHYKNVLNALTNPGAALYGKSADFSPQTLTLTQAGGAVGQFYGFVADGLYRTMDQLNNGPATELGIGQHLTWLGDIRYKNLDGNNAIDSKDQTFIGNPNPKFTYSLTNSFSYKGFDFSIFLNGVYGSKIYNYSRMKTEADYNVYQNQLTSVLNRYSATNTNGSLPRYNQWNNNNLRISSRFIESGSYLRIQNVALGYNLPKKWISKGISNIRMYVSAQNLYTFTKYSGYDPELGSFNNSVLTSNIDYGHYPNPRTVTIGANIDL